MHKLQKRMIHITIAGILAVAIALTTLAIMAFGIRMGDDTSRILRLETEKNVEKLDSVLLSAEQSLEAVKIAVDSELLYVDQIRNEAPRERLTELIEQTAILEAENTEDATAIYFRFNPELAPPTSGFFVTELEGKEGFQSVTPTDITAYAKDDDEHVAWWYRTIEAGRASWIKSYMNKNNGINMISYTMPIYVENTFAGVIGIDIRLDKVKSVAEEIKVFSTGYAMLIENGTVIYPDAETGLGEKDIQALSNIQDGSFYRYHDGSTAMKLISGKLRNGMILAIAAPEAEINAQIRQFMFMALAASFAVLAATWIGVSYFGNKAFTQYQEESKAKQAIITSLSSIYFTAMEVDMQTGKITIIRMPRHLREKWDVDGKDYRDHMDSYVDTFVEATSREVVREFLEFETLMARLHKSGFLQMEYLGLTRGWCRITLVPELEDGEEEIRKVVFALANINEEKNRERQISYKAEHDALTGIYNRAAFARITEEMRGDGSNLAVMVMDVDKFKQVNDTYGHEAGDAALKRVAYLLEHTFRKTDYIIRYGGDEFVILLLGAKEADYHRFETLVAQVNEKLSLPEGKVPALSVSAGIAFSENGYDNESFGQADKALFVTKTNGRRGCSKFSLND